MKPDPTSHTRPDAPNPTDRRLGKHLVWIVLIKLLVLYGLWYGLIRPNKVKVTPADIERIYTSTSGQTPQASPSTAQP